MSKPAALKTMLQVKQMLENGIMQQEIADKMGVTRQTIGRWARKMGYAKRKCFTREIDIIRDVLDEIAPVWAFTDNAPLDEYKQIASIIGNILSRYPDRITCDKARQKVAGIALHRVRLLRILANTIATKENITSNYIFDCFIFMEDITVSVLSLLSE